jgi:hypothetical protein
MSGGACGEVQEKACDRMMLAAWMEQIIISEASKAESDQE